MPPECARVGPRGRGDIQPLVDHFTQKYNNELQAFCPGVTDRDAEELNIGLTRFCRKIKRLDIDDVRKRSASCRARISVTDRTE